MKIWIPKVVHLDCGKEMIPIEGTTERVCPFCEKKIRVEVVEE